MKTQSSGSVQVNAMHGRVRVVARFGKDWTEAYLIPGDAMELMRKLADEVTRLATGAINLSPNARRENDAD